jgi:undecaprenyl-diphosphatase
MSDGRGWRGTLSDFSGLVYRWLAARELATMLLLAALAGGLWVFAEVAEAVLEGHSRALDEALLLAMRSPADRADPLGPEWVEEIGRDLTALGGMTVLSLLTAAAAGYLWLSQRRLTTWLVLLAVGGGQLLSLALKRGFSRPRPDLVPHEAVVYTASFPSGHAMMSAVTYLTLGALLARIVPQRRMKAFVLGWALLFTGLAGASRVYLGVHWPTDVVAGWALGASWAAACWLVADALERRRRR